MVSIDKWKLVSLQLPDMKEGLTNYSEIPGRAGTIRNYYLIISIITTLFILFILFLSYRLYKHDLMHLKQQVIINMTLVGKHVSLKIEKDIDNIIKEIDSISKNCSIIDNDPNRITQILDTELYKLKKFKINNIAIIDQNGNFIVSLFTPPLQQEYLSNQKKYYLPQKLKEKHQFYKTVSNRIDGSKAVWLFIAMPAFDAEGKRVNTVAVFLELTALLENYIDLNTADLYLWLIDQEGKILYHPDAAFISVAEKEKVLSASMISFIDNILANKSLYGEYKSSTGQQTLAAASVFKGIDRDWLIILSTDEKFVKDQIMHFHQDHITLTILIILLAAIGLQIVFNTIVKWNKALQYEVFKRKQAETQKEKLIIELNKALSEVRVLSGFLPICASCKKIRDDKGYWNQIEDYISEHSNALFSHGICPDCAEKLYPDLKLS